jgi:hypothetical protein
MRDTIFLEPAKADRMIMSSVVMHIKIKGIDQTSAVELGESQSRCECKIWAGDLFARKDLIDAALGTKMSNNS